MNRKDIRLSEYDYSRAGAYFVTVCSRNREPLFWENSGNSTPVGATCGRPPLSETGKIVDREIQHLSDVYPGVWVEKYVVMPDHIHLLICIVNEGGRPQVAPTLSRMMQQFKGVTTKRCGRPLWQKGFYDHVIRDDNDFLTKWNYIDTNPARRGEEYSEG